MRKDEHLKIVNGLEAKIQELERQISDLKNSNSKFEFEAKLNKFIADQRLDAINEVLAKNVNDLKNMKAYDQKVKEYYSKSMARIKLDDEKFIQLKNYIKESFPDSVIELNGNSEEIKKSDKDLSDVYIGEGGRVYQPFHIIDIAILIMRNQRQRLNDILGGEDFDIDNQSGDADM